MEIPESPREYSSAEWDAIRIAFPGVIVWRGAPFYAAGPSHVDLLRARADDLEKKIPALRLAADAIEREQRKDGTWEV